MNDSFLALDVETANADYSSICQIGIVKIENAQIIDKWSTLINPESYFDPFNVSIHGIREEDVRDAPTFDKIYKELTDRLEDKITIHHMPFDRIALNRACEEYKLNIIHTRWLDSAKIVRRTWEQYAYKGYGLANIADFLKINFEHHDALEDAITAAKVVLHACEKNQISIEDWYIRISQQINVCYGGSSTIHLEGNPEGSLYGETLVFTGTLSLPRKEVAKIAASVGCHVDDSVTKSTTILVVGTQDTSKLAGYDKSSKHRKAEELIVQGKQIKILSEKDFIEMCNDENKDFHLQVPLTDTIESKPKQLHENQLKHPSFSVGINLTEAFTEKFEELFNNLASEDQKILIETSNKHREFIESIQDCSHDTKRVLGNEFQIRLETIKNSYDKLGIESYEDDSIDVLLTIDSEIYGLTDLTVKLMKNKITLGEFYESIESTIDFIESDLEEDDIPDKVNMYAKLIVKELLETKEGLMTLANK